MIHHCALEGEYKLTFSPEKRGGALQEVSDLLQRSFLPAADAAAGVMATGG